MKEEQKDYKEGDTIYILMDGGDAHRLVDDWLEHDYPCDLLIHRSKKNKGKVVVETKDMMWGTRIVSWHRCKQVTYKSND